MRRALFGTLLGPLLLWAACAPQSPGVQRSLLTGKDGPKTIAGTEIVNRYTTLTTPPSAGDTSLAVTDATGFATGDLVLIVSAQGATIDPNDLTYGSLTTGGGAIGPAGLHEFWVLSGVAGNTLSLDLGCVPAGLANSYPAASKPQVIRVPQYTTLSVPSLTTLTGSPWNGSTGGLVVVHVEGTASVAGTIDASALGFRGGQVTLGSTNIFTDVVTNVANTPTGGEKGESIAGDQATYDGLGGRFGRGAPANGGGGGNGYLAGGGGGAGATGSASGYSGEGTMTNGVTGGAMAWPKDPNFASSGGPGGGRGGYTLSALDQDATMVAPGNAGWAGNGRNERGGLGGHPLATPSRLFLGGGGGAGDFDSGALPVNPAGARGGGIVYLMAQSLTGAGAIRADGAPGRDGALVGTNDIATVANGGGAGGGGGGGMVILRATGNPTVAVTARGGAGGNLSVGGTFAVGLSAASGPGGGGQGGGVATATGLTLGTTPITDPGAGGTTSAAALTEFPSNGATFGGVGATASGVSQSSPPFACLPADVSITIVDSADPVDVSAAYSYTATILNNGPNAAYDLTATITLSTGLAIGTITAAGWACSTVGQVVTCTRALQLSGVSSTIQIAVTAPAAPTTASASGTIASREDHASGNNSATENTVVQFPQADLALTKTGPMATASSEQYTYTLSVKNNGPRIAPSLSVVDTLPGGVSYVSFSGPGWACVNASGTVTCTHAGALASGATSAVDLTVTAPALTIASGVTNNATVSIGSGAADPTAGNNASSVMTTITPVDLSITKTDAVDPVPAGSAITYTITVTNPATVAAHTIVVDDTLPGGTTFVSATGSGWTCSLVTTTVHCTRNTSPASPTATPPITLIVTAPSTQGVISNTATVSSTATDPALGDNTATQQTTISPPAPGSADLSVSIVDAPDPVDINATLGYVVTVSNSGPDPAAGVQMITTLPAGATFVSATGTGWSCNQASSTVTCAYSGTMPAGAAPVINIVVTAPGAAATVSGSAVVTATTPDPAVGNNTAMTSTEVIDPTQLDQAPTITLPSMLSTLEDTALAFAGTTAPLVDDVDAAGAAVELHVLSAGCVLSLSQITGLQLITGDGVLDPELRVRGSIADLNAALNGSVLTPDRDYNGSAQLLFTVDDLGHTGVGGPKQASAPLTVIVIPVDDPATAADDEFTVMLGAGPTSLDVLANDATGDADQVAHIVSVTDAEQGLAQVAGDAASITYTPASRFVGDDHFQYTMTDGTTQVSAKVTVHVPAPTDVHLVGGGLGCDLAAGRASDGACLVLALVGLALVTLRRRHHA